MENHLALEITAIVLLILANGFFVLSEFAVIASRKSRLKQKLEQGLFGARKAVYLHDHPESFLATIQIGIALVGALVGVLSGATFVEQLHAALTQSSIGVVARFAEPLAVTIVVCAITLLSVVFGELVPKYIALSYPEKYARLVAAPVMLFYRASFVVAYLLSSAARGITRALGIHRDPSRDVVSSDEIEHIIVEGREKGMFDIAEEQFVKKLFEFTDATVRRAMKPRPDVTGLDISASPADILKIISENGYSRYPVYEKTLDHVVGVLYTKDLITHRTDLSNINLKSLMREPLFVPDSMPLPRLLKKFRRGKNHLAVVLDEFGGTAGIITLEDILEELVGEIQDEYDAESAPVVKMSETSVHADGSVWPGQINELLQCSLPEDEDKTLAGLFIDEIGRVPERYESVIIADTKLTVLAKDKNRIVRLKVEKVQPVASDQ
jgi:putative hemolysin